jgi:hypothetical protein
MIYIGIMVSMHVTNVEDSGFPLSCHTKDYNFDNIFDASSPKQELNLTKNTIDFLLLKQIQ